VPSVNSASRPLDPSLLRLIALGSRLLSSLRYALDRVLLSAAVRNDPGEARVLRPAACIGFALCATILFAMSLLEYQRFSLTHDFAEIYQAWHQVSQGNLNPLNTVSQNGEFWTGHFELYVWLLAPIAVLFPSPLALELVHDALGIAACLVAWRWMLTLLYDPSPPVPNRRVLALASLCVLLLNPWIYWSYAFDFHSESAGVIFIVASLYAFYLKRTRLGIILALSLLLEGDVTALYLVGLGASLVVVRWRQAWIGAGLAFVGVLWLAMTHAIGAGIESGFSPAYAYLVFGDTPATGPLPEDMSVSELIKGLALHPLPILGVLHEKVLSIYDNLSPIGFIGILSPWTFGVTFLVLLENQLAYALPYAQPSFQTMPVYILGSVGLTWMLAWLVRTPVRRFVIAFAVLAALNTAGWGLVWIPPMFPHWLRTSAATGSVLRTVYNSIPAGHEVITTQGVIGRFASHKYAGVFWFGNPRFVRYASDVDFVVVPYEGINVESVNKSLTILDMLTRDFRARVRLHEHGVWWLSFGSETPYKSFRFADTSQEVPAWACAGPQGAADISGPVYQWAAMSRNARGYVISRAYWRPTAGNYRAGVEIASTGPVTLEVWNQTLDQPIVRTVVPPGPRRRVYVPFRALDRGRSTMFKGYVPFLVNFVEPPVHDNLEVRVFSPGRGLVRVYRVMMEPLPA